MVLNESNDTDTSSRRTNGVSSQTSTAAKDSLYNGNTQSNGNALNNGKANGTRESEGAEKTNGIENAYTNELKSSGTNGMVMCNGDSLKYDDKIKERLKQKRNENCNIDKNDNNKNDGDAKTLHNGISTNGCEGKENSHNNFCTSNANNIILDVSNTCTLHKRHVKEAKGNQPESSQNKDSSSEGRSYSLVKYESLPPFLHDNEFLVEGHRPVLNSTSECFRSVLHLHSETWNIWTHLLGALMTFALMIYYMLYLNKGDSLAFLCFFCGAIFCQSVSSLYHTLICHSEPVCKLFAKLDYCGVITLITTSEIAWLHFAFYCQPWHKTGYIGTAGITFLLSMCLALKDEFREPSYRWIRFGLFFGLALCNVVPTLHYYLLNDPNLPVSHAPIEWVFLMASFYAAGGFIYAIRVPERLCPGKFDIHCQSHQILHVCVIAGVICCYVGLYKYSCLRLSTPCVTH